MAQMNLLEKFKLQHKGTKWIGGVAFGACLIKIPVLGVMVGSFSLFMFLSSIRSDENKSNRLFKKGMKHFDLKHYSYAYILFKKAYELNDENPQIIKMLIETNLRIEKDPVEARILIEELSNKWKNEMGDSLISEFRERLSLFLAS